MPPVVVRALAAVLWLAANLRPPDVRASAPTAPDAFVRVRGRQFVVGDAPFRFVGANASVMHGPRERELYESVLDAAAADGLKVLRIWALGEFPAPGQPHHPWYAFRIGEAGWIEDSFVHLDRVLVAAKARGLRVIIVLANRWKDYGGIATYLTWAGETVQRNARGEPTRAAVSAFLSSGRCQALYREHVQRIVGRVNSLSGLPYRDDPTIMAWELINEASAVTARDEEALVRWVRENARFVRSLDDRHLISAGHIGYRTARERRVWQAVQTLPEIDFADAHTYPFGDRRVAHTSHLARLMDDSIALAYAVIKKPLVFGEFGFERDHASKRRLQWMQAFLDHALSRGTAGALVWVYEPGGSPLRAHTISAAADDAGSRSVRGVLRRAARVTQGAQTPPRLWSRATLLPRFARHQNVWGMARSHRGFVAHDGGLALEIDPTAFARARFEQTGTYREHAFDTVWGAGEGFVEYRFVAPPYVPEALVVEARLSSELPGHGDGTDLRDGSDVEISIDDEVIGIVRARPDDALGESVRVSLHDARALRKIFGTPRRHVLRFRALPSHYAGGLCIYGKPTGVLQVGPNAKDGLRTIRVTLTNAVPGTLAGR